MRCPNCGNENPPDYIFCDECGARLQEGEGTDGSTTDVASGPSSMATPQENPVQQGSGTGGGRGGVIQPISSMVVTPRLEDTPSTVAETEPEALSTPVSNDTAASSGDMAQDGSAVPLTEDTAAVIPADDSAMTGDGSGLSAEPMPDVVNIGASDASMEQTGAATMMSPPDISPAASGTPAVAGDAVSTGWASMALSHLDEAQQAMARGDYVGYGQSLGNLRSLLEGIASGTDTSTGTGTGTGGAGTTVGDVRSGTDQSEGSMAPTPIGAAVTQSSAGSAASSADSLGRIPMVEPAAEAGTLTAEPENAAPVQEAIPAALPVESTVSGAEEPPAVARLVVISTGAELPLPEQEEISVGREDPSSGIFPDVDLTPYGGEEGGVSRRHARLLHIGDDYFVEDLQATNFTKLDGQRLPAHAREKIEDGARLDFGRVAVIFRRS